MKSSIFLWSIFALCSLGLVGCSTTDAYRPAPGSQVYSKGDGSEEVTKKVEVVQQASASEESSVVEEEIETIEMEEHDIVEDDSETYEEKVEVAKEASGSDEEVVAEEFEATPVYSNVAPVQKELQYVETSSVMADVIDGESCADETIIQEASSVISSDPSVTYVETTTEVQANGLAVVGNGFRYLSQDCNVRLSPSVDGYVTNVVPAGQRLWVEEFNENWGRVYRQDGPAYIYKGCLAL